MKILRFILSAFINAYKPSADPNLFGSKKLDKVAGLARTRANETQADIDALKSENPFESSGAKAAMAKASRTAKQMENRLINTMGGNASPEALIAAQGNLNQSIGSAAGEIAAGAEQNKKRETMMLKGLKEQQMGEYGNQKNAANQVKMQGWGTVFQGIDSLSQLAKGSGEAASALMAAGGSDKRIKENIKYIGELQGQRIYKFNFIGNPVVYIGVIAQEIEDKNPEMVIEDDGIKKVHYDLLFSEINE